MKIKFCKSTSFSVGFGQRPPSTRDIPCILPCEIPVIHILLPCRAWITEAKDSSETSEAPLLDVTGLKAQELNPVDFLWLNQPLWSSDSHMHLVSSASPLHRQRNLLCGLLRTQAPLRSPNTLHHSAIKYLHTYQVRTLPAWGGEAHNSAGWRLHRELLLLLLLNYSALSTHYLQIPGLINWALCPYYLNHRYLAQ